jgi:hypothetical protein
MTRIARCTNDIERPDSTATRCQGRLYFEPDDLQSACDTCGAWCGYLVADYSIEDEQLGRIIGDGPKRVPGPALPPPVF